MKRKMTISFRILVFTLISTIAMITIPVTAQTDMSQGFTEVFILSLATYIMEYRWLAAINIAITVSLLWLLVKRYSDGVRTALHTYFAVLTFIPLFLLMNHITRSLRDVDALRARAYELFGITSIPEAMINPSTSSWGRIGYVLNIGMFVLTIAGSVLWLWDIRKKEVVWDYSGMPRWQKWLTWILVFYGMTYLHAMMFGWFLGGIFDIFLLFGLYPCPINMVLVSLLTPLVPKVNKKLFVVICLMAIMGAIGNQMIGTSVNMDAIAVAPAGIYGLVMLWRSMRRKTTI
jgi:hypothetical protein